MRLLSDASTRPELPGNEVEEVEREKTPLLLGGNKWANMSLLFSLSVSWCRLEIWVSKYNNWMSSQALYTQLVFCVQMIPFPFVAWQQQSHAKKNKKVIILE